MRIGLNFIGFNPGKMGGVETYSKNLLHSLQTYDTDNDYLLLCDEWTVDQFPLFNPKFTVRTWNYRIHSSRWLARGVLLNLCHIDILKFALDSLVLDVMHHPFTVLNPRGLSIPSVLTFHDMQQEFHPEFFSRVELWRRKRSYRPSAKEADRIIAISGHVKSCLTERYDIDSGKIDVIHSGYGPQFHVIKNLEILESIRFKYGLNMPFMLYPAASWPHKNHVALLAAIKALKEKDLFSGEVVFTGASMGGHLALVGEIERLGLEGSVRLLGYVPDEDMPSLYNLATMLVFPSLFEGFGIPLVEAMACGCPVVCSGITSLPEIIGKAGVLFDPCSVGDMAEKIALVWNDADLRTDLKEKGMQRVSQFTWENTAHKTRLVYKSVVTCGDNRSFST